MAGVKVVTIASARGRAMKSASSFSTSTIDRIGHYVYLLVDPSDGEVFYIGKGTANRCFEHIVEARKSRADSEGDYSKLARIRQIEKAGHIVLIEILRHGLDEATALHVEAAAIDLSAHSPLTNRVAGHAVDSLGRILAREVESRYANPVTILPEHRVVLITINREFRRGLGPGPLYEATRRWWRVGKWARDPDGSRSPQWAFAVYRGVVRGVYRLESWEPAPGDDRRPNIKTKNRWGFVGELDSEMEDHYLNRDVAAHQMRAQNPIRYVNCKR